MLKHVACAAMLVGSAVGQVRAGEASWQGKTILLTRPGVKLEEPAGEKIVPKTAGVSKDLMFQVRKDEDGRLRIDSRRQHGWIAKSDAVPFEQAVAHFTKALAADPKDSHALTARGIALASMKQPDKALDDFNKAIELDAKAILAYYHRANCAYGRAEYDGALEDYNTVIRLDPEFDWAYHVRGWIYYRKKDYDKAVADYETAVRLVPTENVFYRDLGNVALAQKQHDKALGYYAKALDIDPTNAAYMMERAGVHIAKKDYVSALADYEKAASSKTPEAFISYFQTPLALFLAGCPDAKLRDGKRALAIAEKVYAVTKGAYEMASLAAAHAELGQFDQAIAWQTKAIDAALAPVKNRYRDRLKLYEDGKPYRLE